MFFTIWAKSKFNLQLCLEMLFQMFHFSKQITAVKEYDVHLSAKSLTNKSYEIWSLKEAGIFYSEKPEDTAEGRG